ncbi:uncharacterized protein LOC129592959 [Paramacrobiotus metropolitanus]|uniref:uncharacterized protein LOC129592959 n=1 Tax=Paramacrobiotus metropolitanus TaxID=2943436 RepID=UPI0024456065|nr:uncharacterized protein LOC129592959 [Paramacrobiotus metropolitanus]
MLFFSILSQKMDYVHLRTRVPVTSSEIVEMFHRKRQRCFGNRRFDDSGNPEDDEPKRKTPGGEMGRALALPVEVLKEVFFSLDTVDRQRCRRTCQLWETLLTSAELCRDVHASCIHRAFSPHLAKKWNGNYVVYNCLFKYISRDTETVCIHDTDVNCSNYSDLSKVDEALKLIKHAADKAGIRVQRIIMHRCSLTIDYPLILKHGFSTMAALRSSLSTVCDRLIWKDQSLQQREESGATILLEFRIPFEVFILSNADEAQIWEVAEKHLLCSGPALDMERIAQYIAKGHFAHIQAILQAYEGTDPRSSAYSHGVLMTEDDIANVDVRKLNKLCLHALWYYVK